MKTRHGVMVSVLAGAALSGLAIEGLRAEDQYIRNLPLDALTLPVVPVPVVPPGSTLDLRPNSSPNSADQLNRYSPGTQDEKAPSIGLSIKAPVDNGK
jgi:hypothetical protein